MTVINAQPNPTGGAPTPDANDQLQPRTADQLTPATPSATAQDPNAAPQVTMPAGAPPNLGQAPTQMPTLAQQTQKQNQPHLISRIFDGIFKTMTGGPVTYIDANGQKQVAPQSRGTMGKSIVAAALAGLLTPTQYREGAFGSHVEDFGATAGGAAAAGKGVMDAYRNKPQQMSDDEQARKLMVLTSNANNVRNMAASALQQHVSLQAMVDSSKPLMDSILAYEKTRVDKNQPQALIENNLSLEDAKAKLKGHVTEWKAIPVNTETVLDPVTGKNEEHPLYAVINPNVKVPLSEEAVNTLATVNPTYKGAWEATNGKVEVPLSVAISTQNLVNEAHVVQAFADSSELKSAFPGMKQANVAAALRGPNGKQLIPALDATRDAIAAGSPPYKKLNAITTAPNGGALLDALGLSPDAVNEYVKDQTNKAIREQVLANEGGVGDKAPVSAAQQKTLQSAINKMEDPDERASLLAMIPPDRLLTMGEFQKVGNELRQSVQRLHEDKLKTGDPVVLQSEADSMLNGNVSNPKDLATIRSGGARMLIDSFLQKGAEARGLNPVNHTFATQEAKARTFAEYSDPQSKVGAQLSSFDTLMRHTAEGLDANEKWVRSGSPLINKTLTWLAENATNDQDYQTFRDTIIAPMKEYMNFLNQNHAEQETDRKLMDGVIGKDATAKTALTALKVLTQTADARAAALGQKYLNTVKANYEGLISPTALQVMQRFGIKSQAGPLSVQLPRGWNSNNPTTVNPQDPRSRKIVQMYIDAAGGNADLAKQLLKENGWK